jgi:hypothetical protein
MHILLRSDMHENWNQLYAAMFICSSKIQSEEFLCSLHLIKFEMIIMIYDIIQDVKKMQVKIIMHPSWLSSYIQRLFTKNFTFLQRNSLKHVWSRAKEANQSEAKSKIVFHKTNATPNNMHVWIITWFFFKKNKLN